jgi:hypothetical protein
MEYAAPVSPTFSIESSFTPSLSAPAGISAVMVSALFPSNVDSETSTPFTSTRTWWSGFAGKSLVP